MIFKSHIGSSSFFNASIGIFLNSAAFLYSSENSPTSSAVPSICSDLSPPKEAPVSKTAAAICLFSFKALNLSPPSVKIQSAPVYQLYSSGVQRIKSFVAVARARTLWDDKNSSIQLYRASASSFFSVSSFRVQKDSACAYCSSVLLPHC